jgi:hypothetical protein
METNRKSLHQIKPEREIMTEEAKYSVIHLTTKVSVTFLISREDGNVAEIIPKTIEIPLLEAEPFNQIYPTIMQERAKIRTYADELQRQENIARKLASDQLQKQQLEKSGNNGIIGASESVNEERENGSTETKLPD